MTIREIPRSFLYTCDACLVEHRQENAQGHYTESVPSHWSRIRIRKGSDIGNTFDAYERLLCEACGPKVISIIDSIIDSILTEGGIKNDTD